MLVYLVFMQGMVGADAGGQVACGSQLAARYRQLPLSTV
jgi:hypothetical protein